MLGTDLLNLKVLRPEIFDDLLVGLGGLRDRRPEPVEYTLDRELLHRVCQMGSATRGGITCAIRAVRPSVPLPWCTKSRPGIFEERGSSCSSLPGAHSRKSNDMFFFLGAVDLRRWDTVAAAAAATAAAE